MSVLGILQCVLKNSINGSWGRKAAFMAQFQGLRLLLETLGGEFSLPAPNTNPYIPLISNYSPPDSPSKDLFPSLIACLRLTGTSTSQYGVPSRRQMKV